MKRGYFGVVGVLCLLGLSMLIYSPIATGLPSQATTTEPLTTSAVPKSVVFSQSHLVQPIGNYKFTPSGGVYSSNGGENVSLIPQASLGAYSSYKSNSTFFQYSSSVLACQVSITYKQSGTDLKQNIEGTNCPLGSYSFSLTSLKGTKAVFNSTLKSVVFNGIAYTWANDLISGATVSYANGIVTFTTSSPNFKIDPSVVQTKGCDQGGSGNSVTCAYTSNVTAGNILAFFAMAEDYTSGVTCPSGPSISADTQSLTWTLLDTQCANNDGGDGRSAVIWAYYATAASTGAESITFTIANCPATGCRDAGITLKMYEMAGVTTIGVTDNKAHGAGTSLSVTGLAFAAGAVLLAGMSSSQGGAYTPGTGFTLLAAGTFNYQNSQYATSGITSPSTFPATSGDGGTNTWAEIGAQFPSLSPHNLVLLVSPSPAPDGGAIFKQATTTTISSSTTITVSGGTATTFTITAQEFASYVWWGWAGATTLVQDAINPTQTVVINSWTTTTISDTLTALFSVPVTTVSYLSTACATSSFVTAITTISISCSAAGGGTGQVIQNGPLFALGILAVMIALLAFVKSRR